VALRQVLEGHIAPVSSLALSRDGCYLYSGSDDRSIHVWDVSGGLDARPSQLHTLTGHTGYVASLSLSIDGLTLYSSQMGTNSAVYAWSAEGLQKPLVGDAQQQLAAAVAGALAACDSPPAPRDVRGASANGVLAEPAGAAAVPGPGGAPDGACGAAGGSRQLATLTGHTAGVYSVA